MKEVTRREFIGGTLAGASLLVLGPALPGCTAAVKPTPLAGNGAAMPQAAPEELARFFGVSRELARRVLDKALANGGDFADLYCEHTVTDYLKLEEGQVNVAAAGINLGAGVRVVIGDQSGYAYTEALTEEALLRAAATAAMIAGAKAPGALPELQAVQIESRYPIKLAPTELAVGEKMALLRRMDRAARAASAKVHVVVPYHNNEYKRVLLFRSDGRMLADARPKTSLGCFITVKEGSRTERQFYEEGGRRDHGFFSGERPEAIAREAVKRGEICLQAVVPPAGEMPVVLAPGQSGILLHEAIGHGLEADFNRKKVSIYAGRVGQQVASPLCTIIDDGTIQHSQGSLNFDDEGSSCRRNVLIENGVLRAYMQDRISTKFFGVEPTGNGRRESYRFPPMPRMTNTYLLNGPHTKEEVFAGIERGIYAIDFTNGQVEIGPGDYTFFVSYGYLIEKGKLTSPIKDVNIVGNGPESLTRVDRLANDLQIHDSGQGACGKNGQRVPVNYGVPHLRISRANVGGRASA